MSVLQILHSNDGLELTEIASKTNLRADKVRTILKYYMTIGYVYYQYGRDDEGVMKLKYYLNPDIIFIRTVHNKKEEEEECWSSAKFLEENKRLTQMIDMDFMLTI